MKAMIFGAMMAAGLAAPALAQIAPADVRAGAYKLDPEHGKITWEIDHLGFSTYVGQFANVTGTLKLDPKNPAKSSVIATVQIASVGTLNTALDKNIQSPMFFDAAKYPTATFVSTSVRANGASAVVMGNLTMHGVTKPVTLNVTFNAAGTNPVENVYEVGFDATATLKRSDFGLKAYLPALGDDVALSIEGEFHAS